MWNPVRRHIWAALLALFSTFTLNASTITAMVFRVTGAPSTNSVISLYPSNTPVVLNGGFSTSPSAQLRIGSSGWGSNTLVTGNYRFSIDQSTRDFGAVWIPDDNNTYNLWSLITSTNVLFNTNISSLVTSAQLLSASNALASLSLQYLLQSSNYTRAVSNYAFTASNYLYTALAPVGTIIGWQNHISGTPGPYGTWVEMHGQTLNDPASPYNGQVIPDYNGLNLFLRGNADSGGTGGAATHEHVIPTDTSASFGFAEVWGHLNQNPLTSSASSLPPYVNVIWLMRVK